MAAIFGFIMMPLNHRHKTQNKFEPSILAHLLLKPIFYSISLFKLSAQALSPPFQRARVVDPTGPGEMPKKGGDSGGKAKGKAKAKAGRAAKAARQAEPARKVEVIYTDIHRRFITSTIKKLQTESCWAISIAECVEACYNMSKEDVRTQWLELSPQYLMDYVSSNKESIASFANVTKLLVKSGIPKEESYPFRGPINPNPPEHVYGPRVFITLGKEENEALTQQMVIEQLNDGKGPVVVVFPTDVNFKNLKPEDIYEAPMEIKDKKTGKSNLFPHAVVVTGYGNTFWVVRNCYGDEWCNGGFGRISRNVKILKVWYPVGVY